MKLFKNCPEEGRTRCENCPRLKKCILRKLKRRFVKKMRSISISFNKKYIFLTVVLFFIMFLSLNYKVNVGEEEYFLKEIETVKAEENENIKNEVQTVRTSQSTQTPKCVEKVKAAKKSEKKVKKDNKKRASSKKKKVSSKVYADYPSITTSEEKLMEKVVYQEARGEPFEGQVAVAAVILNRYMFNNKQKSIREIVTAPNQFADISNVTQNMLNAYPNCEKAVKKALEGNDPTRKKFSKGARYFFEPNLVSGYQKKIRQGIEVLKIGNHYFHNDFNE